MCCGGVSVGVGVEAPTGGKEDNYSTEYSHDSFARNLT